uniref:Leucine rich repeat containing 7 n=1 Tax=Cyprinus carpio TaxID=7962 RepID=A0A8C2L139_CYPCA
VQCLEMTTKRKFIGRLVPCRCFRGEEEVISVLDYSHCSLQQVPKEIFSFERTLEELYLDANQIEELPKQLFNCQALKKLSMPDNDLSSLPTTIASLVNLKELDISKNGIQEFPDNIKCCKCLSVVEASVNPIAKLPDGFTQLLSLTQLFLNDAFLEYLPANFGRSIHRLSQLERLDLGSNEFSELVRKILSLLEEFDCSCNELESLPPTIGYLHSLRTFAADENFLTELPREIGNCRNVTVMSLRSNKLEFLPDEIGQMTKLRVLNLSDNRLKNLPFTFTKLKDLAALWLSDNQSKALIPLQTEAHPETKQRVLTNYMFPQQPRHDEDYQSDSDSFNPTLWEEQRQQRMTVAFEFEDKKEEEDNSGKVKVPLRIAIKSNSQLDIANDKSNTQIINQMLKWQITDQMQIRSVNQEKTFISLLYLQVEINLKRYPTPYPEDLKNMVKSVQNLVGKTTHTLNTEKCSSGTNMELHSQDKYEPKWPIAPKEDSMGGSPNDIRISDMRPTLVEPAMYKPKVVLLGKEKKESTDESEPDKMQCLNNSGSSATYSDYSPSQGSSGSSNPPGNVSNLQTSGKEGPSQTHWTNRLAQSFPKPIDSKPLLSQRETPPSSTLQQRGERRPLSDTFDSWNNAPHYDNTGFVAEETPLNTPSSSAGNPMLGSKPRSASMAHGRRPLMRQERIVGVPLELDQSQHTFHNVRTTSETEVPPPSNPWQNWTRTPSPFEDRTAFPSKLEITPANSPNPDRKDFEQEMGELPGTFPSTGAWGFLDTTDSGTGRGHPNISSLVQGVKEPNKIGTLVVSKSSERLSPMMKEVKAKFKKSQSIDEIDTGSYKVYSIPLDSYSSSIENQGSVDRADLPVPLEQSMSRSQSAPMLDDDLDGFGSKSSQQQKPAIPKKVYHFDQSFNPQGAMDLMKAERRVPPPFPNAPEYVNQPGKTLPKELVSPRGYRGYPPMEQMFSFAQTAVTDDAINPQLSVQPQRSRPGFLRRADSLVSSTEMALFRRVAENHELQLAEHYNRPQQSMLEQQNSLSTITDTQFHKRNGRYDEDYSSYQEPKKPIMGYPTKSLTQRRPLSARSYSTETYGASQARPVSARPTMAALLEKLPSDYNLSTCIEKSSEADMKMRPVPQKQEDPTSKMPVDWRQQLLRHIEAKRLDRVSKQTMMMTSATPSHRTARDQQYEGAINKVSIQQYQSPLPMPITTTSPRPQSARCFIQTKGQKSMDGFPEQLCVRIEKNPGLGFSISGGISGQGNPFKPSDMVRPFHPQF